MTTPIAVPHMDPSDAHPAVAGAVEHAVSRLEDATPTHVPKAGFAAGLSLSPAMSAMPPLLNDRMVRSLLLRALPEMLAHLSRQFAPKVRSAMADLHAKLSGAGYEDGDIASVLEPFRGLIDVLESGNPGS